MIYNRKPRRVEAARVEAVDWNPETGYHVKFDDGTSQVLPFRSFVPCIGDYWTDAEGFKNGTDFDREYEKSPYPQEVILPRVS